MIPVRSLWYLLRLLLKPVLIFSLILYGTGLVLFPWAMPVPGSETLSGSWIGTLESSRGPATALRISLDLKPSLAGAWTYIFDSPRTHSHAGAQLQGQAQVCTRQIGQVLLDVAGFTTAWSGETLDIRLTPHDARRRKPRFHLTGRWIGAQLEFEESINNLDEALGVPGKGGNNEQDWIRSVLHKGTENDWLTLCGKSG